MPKKQHNGSPADVELMALWADDEEIVCIHPNGPRLVGHRAIRESWQMILDHGGLPIAPTQLHEMHNLMASVHTVVEGTSSAEGQPVHLVATNVYMKTPKGWRMVAHHVSAVPGPVPDVTHGQVLH